MYTNFKEFITAILAPIMDILKLLSPNLSKIIAVCIIFIVALAVKRGVTN